MSHSCCDTKLEKQIIGNITCPNCKHIQSMQIPADRCIPMYKCNKCKKIIHAKKKCCVFCDYGDRPCPVGGHN